MYKCIKSIWHIKKDNIIKYAMCDSATMICIDENKDCFIKL